MRTIEEIKDEIIEFYFYATTVEGKLNEDNFIQKLDELIKTVATLQREKCAEEANLLVYGGYGDEGENEDIVEEYEGIDGDYVVINVESILNAKL